MQREAFYKKAEDSTLTKRLKQRWKEGINNRSSGPMRLIAEAFKPREVAGAGWGCLYAGAGGSHPVELY